MGTFLLSYRGDIIKEFQHVNEAEAGAPLVLAVLHHGDRDSGNASGTHELCDRCFNQGALLGRELRLLRGADSGGGEQEAEKTEKKTQ